MDPVKEIESGSDFSLNDCEQQTFIAKEDKTPDFKLRLMNWATEQNITYLALDKLLHILKDHECFSHLPATACTLLATPRETNKKLRPVATGSYCHFGLANAIREAAKNTSRST